MRGVPGAAQIAEAERAAPVVEVDAGTSPEEARAVPVDAAAAQVADAETAQSPAEPTAASGRPASFVALGRVTAVVVAIGVALLGWQTWQGTKRVGLKDAAIRAPQIVLPAHGGGTLKQVYVSVGDDVAADRPIARVGSEVITSDVPGTVVAIREDIGATLRPGAAVATLIDRDELRAVGLVDEDGGLADLRIGQRASVEVDAFGGRSFGGVVEEIATRPHEQAVSFSISDRDEARQYEVEVRLDRLDPGLRQGMSAEVEVFK